MSRQHLTALAQGTYDKGHWSAEDVWALRGCWDVYQSRGEDTIPFCRPAYSDVLTFHESDVGEMGEDDVRFLERAGAVIAADSRAIMRKLRSAPNSA